MEKGKWREARRREARNEWKLWMEGREWNGEVPWSDLMKEKQGSGSTRGLVNETWNESFNEFLSEFNDSKDSLEVSKASIDSKDSKDSKDSSNELNDSPPTNSLHSPTPLNSSTSSPPSNSQSTLQTHSESTEENDPAFSSAEWSESMRAASSLQFMNQLLIQQLAEERKRSSEAVSSEIWKQTKEEAENLRSALEKAKKENEELRELLSKTDLTDYQFLEDSQEGSELV